MIRYDSQRLIEGANRPVRDGLQVSAFGTLALSFWPHMIPFVITVDEAAAPQSSLMFMVWGGVVVFPLMLLYTLINYTVFRGKVGTTAG